MAGRATGPALGPRRVRSGMITTTPVYCLAYSRDGRYLAMGTEARNAGDATGEVRLWDIREGRDKAVFAAR